MLKTKKTKMSTIRKTKRRLKHQYKRSKTKEQFLKICTKASRRSKKRRMKCRLIRLRTNRSRLPKIAGPWNSSMLTATSKLKLSLFPISCNARCKSKTNKFCLTLWSVRITFFYTHGVAKCGLCQQTFETEWRTCVDCSQSSQISFRVILFQRMLRVVTALLQTSLQSLSSEKKPQKLPFFSTQLKAPTNSNHLQSTRISSTSTICSTLTKRCGSANYLNKPIQLFRSTKKRWVIFKTR